VPNKSGGSFSQRATLPDKEGGRRARPMLFDPLSAQRGERFRDKSEKSEKVDGCHREQARFGRTANHYYMYTRKKKSRELQKVSVSQEIVESKHQ
jgi:hypothetical protein